MLQGQFPPAVMTVIEFFGSGKVLGSPESGDTNAFAVVTRFAEAKVAAWEATYGRSEMTWSDIRSEQMSKVWKVVYGTPGHQELDRRLKEVFGTVEKAIRRNLGTTAFGEILDDGVADFRLCLYGRAFPGDADSFVDSMFDAYQNGGWPCGWSGAYPDGNLLVYVP